MREFRWAVVCFGLRRRRRSLGLLVTLRLLEVIARKGVGWVGGKRCAWRMGAYSAESKGSCEAMVIEFFLPLAVKVV